ncbi:hypothetical protein CPB85DRAFT_1431167 [Mucidula mucida]|nr:hypothetical protein CPB85DRAFT_1431167 [Mucidula mucida]
MSSTMDCEFFKFDLAANSMDRPPCSRHTHGRSTAKELICVNLINDMCIIRSLDKYLEEYSYALDDMNRHYPGFLLEVVSVARWRSSCVDRQCRICQLPEELRSKDSVDPADVSVDSSSKAELVETAVDASIPLVRRTPTPTHEPEPIAYSASPSPPPRPRYLSTPSDEPDDSMDDVSTTSYSPSPPPPQKRSAKTFKFSQTRSRGTRRKTTARVHAEYDKTIVAASEIKTTENSPVSGPAKTLHEAVFDYITRSPTDRWIAIIALLTNRTFKQVSCWFMNRRYKFEFKLLEESDPKWRSYYETVEFDLPDGSMIPLRLSAIERWRSCRWTDEDFERILQEELMPILDVLEVSNQAKRETVPWYGHAKQRFPARVKKAQGESEKKRRRRR